MYRLMLIGLGLAVSILLYAHAAAAMLQEEEQGEAEEVQLIKGLDGGTYEPYKPSVVEEVKRALQAKGMYTGEIDGILDQATMEAIGEFQKQNGIMVSGVPSPATRRLLLGDE